MVSDDDYEGEDFVDLSGLNPCCNGTWSRTELDGTICTAEVSLNPCCNGTWSRTLVRLNGLVSTCEVLILVVMEHGLGPSAKKSLYKKEVLILVVMEHGLGLNTDATLQAVKGSLNPCCNGTWSRTKKKSKVMTWIEKS